MRIPSIRPQNIPLTAPPPTCQFCQCPDVLFITSHGPIQFQEARTTYYASFLRSCPVNFASIEFDGRFLSFVVIFKSL